MTAWLQLIDSLAQSLMVLCLCFRVRHLQRQLARERADRADRWFLADDEQQLELEPVELPRMRLLAPRDP